MASWMVHLRMADRLLDAIPRLSPTEFIVGNIAPDSGVPNEDWSAFTPGKTVSHFQTDGKNIDISAFVSRYFTPEMQGRYDQKQYSFFLGYLVHLLTDNMWVRDISHPTAQRFREERAADKKGYIARVKEDWYDQDHLYLRSHPDVRAFSLYEKAVGFQNTFMTEFSPDAFDNRRVYITAFYRQGSADPDREYPYLTAAEMDRFVENGAAEILRRLNEYCGG